MKEKMLHSFRISLEWRLIAFLVTNIFLWATTHEFWSATIVALELQVVLFVVNFVWFFFRQEHYESSASRMHGKHADTH